MACGHLPWISAWAWRTCSRCTVHFTSAHQQRFWDSISKLVSDRKWKDTKWIAKAESIDGHRLIWIHRSWKMVLHSVEVGDQVGPVWRWQCLTPWTVQSSWVKSGVWYTLYNKCMPLLRIPLWMILKETVYRWMVVWWGNWPHQGCYMPLDDIEKLGSHTED